MTVMLWMRNEENGEETKYPWEILLRESGRFPRSMDQIQLLILVGKGFLRLA